MADLYRDYFDIDPEFFPAVNDSVIAQHPNLWEKFYPHETFVKLLRDLISCVSHKQHLSVWVEGEYGTGKSHAVLTLKRLLEADDETTKNYFDRFPDLLGNDLYNKLYSLKHQGKILVVHRYASSDISNEENLLFDVQDSIVKALRKNGYEEGSAALGTSAIQWLSDSHNKDYFNGLMKETYSSVFGGDDVDGLIQKLSTFEGVSLTETMANVMLVAKERGIHMLSLTRSDLQDWIRSVIRINQLYAIVFIWDEFTDFFRNNLTRLSGLQALVEMSAADNFYLIPVTHNVANLFPAKDKDWNVISQRFVQPFCNIRLPDNMAFKLMGKAMEKKKDDPVLEKEWAEDCDELYERTRDARQLVKKKANIQDQELRDVLPLHPYAALLLKNMASYYAGDVRSMFDFLVNDADTDIRGFRWFIDNYGPFGAADGSSDNPLLTVDMLWDFFYEKGKELLENDVRRVLDNFGQAQNLIGDEPRIFKAVLLMQAIYERTGSTVEELAPSERNIEFAFMGSDLEEGQPTKIAESLVRKSVLYQPPGTQLYKAMTVTTVTIPTVEYPFSGLVEEADMASIVAPKDALGLRYHMTVVSDPERMEVQLKGIINGDPDNRIHAAVAFAKNSLDAYEMGKAIQKYVSEERFQSLVFINATLVPLGDDQYQQVCDSKSKYEHWLKQKKDMAAQYGVNVKNLLGKWNKSVSQGDFILSWDGFQGGLRVSSLSAMFAKLGEINLQRYPMSLESFADHAITTVWASTYLKSSALYGAGSKTLNQLASAPKDLGEAWTTERYWDVYPLLPISKIKSRVDALIEKSFQEGTNISIREIYEFLYEKPYGFMACNQTAFMLGFLLKEYADGSYTCTDTIKSEKLTAEKLASIIEECMKNRQTPSPKYKDKYIAKITEEIQAFQKASAVVFDRPITVYTVEDIRETVVRASMKRFTFPVWYLKYALAGVPFQNNVSAVQQLIDLYTALANSGNAVGRSDTEIASDIGRLCMDSPGLAEDLASVLNDAKVIEGMKNYLATFDDGILPTLGNKVGDDGKYMNCLKTRFGSVDDANWLWMKETGDEQIRGVIREYQIIDASNQIIRKSKSYGECIYEWCNTCNGIHVSYLYAVNEWDDLGPFMEMLYNIKKRGDLPQNQQEKFLQLLSEKGEAFRQFTARQEPIFARSCSYMLEGLDQDSVHEVYQLLTDQDLFTAERKYYQKQVQATVQAWKDSQVGAQLLKLWKDSTNTDSPRAWSQKYAMPILCMVDESADELKAKAAFDTINAVAKKGKPSGSDIEKALNFLQANGALLGRLADPDQREEAFRRRILGPYVVLLRNVNEVQAELQNKLHVDPYDWLSVQKVHKVVEQKAQFEYTDNGAERASAKIDQMDAAEAKRYLKNLIEDNMAVGIAILQDKR